MGKQDKMSVCVRKNEGRSECDRCLMDSSAADFRRGPNGGCNYCHEFQTRFTALSAETASDSYTKIEDLRSSANLRDNYDCVVGVSGGVDSSWVLVKAVELGFRPLAVHMDNGWNSELAVNNISNLVSKLGVDLHTHVIEWPQYRAMMQGFFDADVVDIELLYDNAMLGVCFGEARKRGLRLILAGSNQATEGIRMPEQWAWRDKRDSKNIADIVGAKLEDFGSFPSYSNYDFVKDRFFHRIAWVPFLDFVGYDKGASLQRLQDDYDFKPYPFKHYENTFTRFYQGFILPEKFGFDKRRPHLSALVLSGQMALETAKSILKTSPYQDPTELERDKTFFLKKMGWTNIQLEEYLSRESRSHDEWDTDVLGTVVFPLYRKLKGIFGAPGAG